MGGGGAGGGAGPAAGGEGAQHGRGPCARTPRTPAPSAARRAADAPQLWDGETLLRGEDVNTLAAGRWLGDEVIGFWLEYLALVCREERVDPPRYPFEPVLGLPPGMAFTLAHLPGPEAAAAVLGPVVRDDTCVALIPVNNNEDVAAWGGGSHWSLLVYVKHWLGRGGGAAATPVNAFFHVDSMAGSNEGVAFAMADLFRHLLPAGEPGAAPPRKVACRAPQQRNGFDCGAYLCGFARVVCEVWLDLCGGRDVGTSANADLEAMRAGRAGAPGDGAAEFRQCLERELQRKAARWPAEDDPRHPAHAAPPETRDRAGDHGHGLDRYREEVLLRVSSARARHRNPGSPSYLQP